MNFKTVFTLAATLASLTANAAGVEVKAAWVRGTVPAQTATGAFMELTSKAGATLVGAASPVADEVQVHEMKLEGGVMKMREAPRLALPAGETVTLKPGGYHIMLMGLKQQMKPGDSVPITLKVEDRKKMVEEITVKAEVRALNVDAGMEHHHMH